MVISGKNFKVLLTEEQIVSRIRQIASEISAEAKDKNPVFLVNLSGAMFFACELLKNIEYPCEVYPIKFSSYVNNRSSMTVRNELFPDIDLQGRNVYVLEDIADTGLTALHLLDFLKNKGCKSCKFAVLLVKPKKLQVPLKVDYAGFEIGDEYVAGFGLDVDFTARNLRNIYIMTEDL